MSADEIHPEEYAEFAARKIEAALFAITDRGHPDDATPAQVREAGLALWAGLDGAVDLVRMGARKELMAALRDRPSDQMFVLLGAALEELARLEWRAVRDEDGRVCLQDDVA